MPPNSIQTAQINQQQINNANLMAANQNAKIRPMINTPNVMINTGVNPVFSLNQQQIQPQQSSLNVINNNPNLATSSIQSNIQYSVQPGQPNPSAAISTSNADDEKYNRKIEELREHLPRLEKMYSNASG